MINYLIKKFVLSDKGARDLIKSVVSCVFSYITMMLPAGLVYILVSQLMSPLLNNTLSYSKVFYIVAIIVIILLLFITQFIQYNNTFINSYNESATHRISLAEKLRKLPLSYFCKKDLSNLTTTIMADGQILETAFSHFIPQFIGSMVATSLVGLSLFLINVPMAIAAFWCIPVSFAIVYLSRKIQIHVGKKVSSAKLDCAGGIQEWLETIKDLKSYNAHAKYLNGLNKKIDAVEKKSITAELTVAIFVISSQMILKLGIISVVFCGSIMLINGSINVLIFFIFLLTVSRLYDSMTASLMNLAAIFACDHPIQRTSKLINYPSMGGKNEFTINSSNIKFENVSFAYNEGNDVLKNCSFIAKQGEVTALIGPSGSGKSTISKLAARFWDIQSGAIYLDNQNIAEIDPETLLKNYSIVFQDIVLFNSSIKDNIKIGNMNASDEEIIQAAKLANCDDFILKQKDGYDTLIGENGLNLSGGERQRISIARAILKDAPIILLDESTASLDAENETKIQEALSKLIVDKTVIVIAHRMRTVVHADHIVVLKDGEL